MEEMTEEKTVVAETARKMDNWQVRRLFMLLQMLFCKVVVAYVLWTGAESRVAETAVDFSFVLMGTIILAYVFGASWQDVAMAKLRKPV